jgi:hypothetical protein
MEVKTIGRDATKVRINGLSQLDAGPDPLVLVVVRAEATGATAPGAVTAPGMVSRVAAALSDDPDASAAFESALASLGWHEHPSHEMVALRPVQFDAYDVNSQFPRLTSGTVPDGVNDADYSIVLPRRGRTIWRGEV